MSHHNLYSEFMPVIQDEVFIRYAFYIFGVHNINTKGLISNFESTQQDIFSKNHNNMIENRNQHHIYRWDSALLRFSLGHQSYTNWEIKYECCARITLKFS